VNKRAIMATMTPIRADAHAFWRKSRATEKVYRVGSILFRNIFAIDGQAPCGLQTQKKGIEARRTAATVNDAKWCARRNRCLEATGVIRLNAQSPSELQWRLRVKSRHVYGFDNMMDLGTPLGLMDSRR